MISVAIGTAVNFNGATSLELSFPVSANDKALILFGYLDSDDVDTTATGYVPDLQTASRSMGVGVLRKDIGASGTETVTVNAAGAGGASGWAVPLVLTSAVSGAGTNSDTAEQFGEDEPDYPTTDTLPDSSGIVIALMATSGDAGDMEIDTPSGYTPVYVNSSWNDLPVGFFYKLTSSTDAEDPAGGTLAVEAGAIQTGIIYYSATVAAAPADFFYPRTRMIVVDRYFSRS